MRRGQSAASRRPGADDVDASRLRRTPRRPPASAPGYARRPCSRGRADRPGARARGGRRREHRGAPRSKQPQRPRKREEHPLHVGRHGRIEERAVGLGEGARALRQTRRWRTARRARRGAGPPRPSPVRRRPRSPTSAASQDVAQGGAPMAASASAAAPDQDELRALGGQTRAPPPPDAAAPPRDDDDLVLEAHRPCSSRRHAAGNGPSAPRPIRRAGGSGRRPSAGGRARRACRSRWCRCRRGRASPAPRAGRRPARPGGWRTSGAACAARSACGCRPRRA